MLAWLVTSRTMGHVPDSEQSTSSHLSERGTGNTRAELGV